MYHKKTTVKKAIPKQPISKPTAKKKKRKYVHGPVTLTKEALEKIADIRAKLADMKAYKELIAQDGIKPDRADKERESSLIVQLLRLEKGLSAHPAVKKKVRKNKYKDNEKPALIIEPEELD
jgi:hypothetical protein